ncbi:MAG: MBL fold metallo-hydrolase [Gammaproteobacteria bacterium]|nr:MBL fold metallo-hydrolase [Gammaproteobacteria bacterium]
MSSTKFVLIVPVTVVLLLLLGNSVVASTSILPSPQKLSQHVYAWIGPLEGPSEKNHGYRMNLVFVVGSSAVAVIDTGYTPEMAKEMLGHIRKITPLPIRYAINTSSQPHRYMGNDVFAASGAETIAHKNSVARMEASGNLFAMAIENILKKKPSDVKLPKKPTRIIEDDITLDLGNLDIHIRHMGAAHTPAQLIVEIPNDKLVYTGDLLYSERLLAILDVSDVKNWLAAYDALKQYQDIVFIPGHGQPASLEAFEFPTRSYLAMIDSHMSKAVDEMTELQDAIKSLDQSGYKHLVNFEQLAGRNANLAYLFYERAGM